MVCYVFCVHVAMYCMLVNNTNSLIQTFFFSFFECLRIYLILISPAHPIVNYSIEWKASM